MRKKMYRITAFCVCTMLLVVNYLTPVGFAASDIYELAFDNLFVFEQWANHPNSGVVSPALTGGELTKDIEAGSFTLTNNSSDSEIYTSHSMGSNTGYYSMPVKPNTSYTFEYSANGTVTSFETFVFYFDSLGQYISLENRFASQYGNNMWTFTTPENAEFIQIRFDNNSIGSYATVSDIRICETEVYEYSKDNVFRKTYTYSSNAVYGTLPEPRRDNLVFAGWYTGPDGTGEKITADTAVSAASYSLYAKWEPMLLGDLALVSLPDKQEYCLGEKLNTEGLSISVTYPDGTMEILESGFSCSPEILNETGTQTITVSFGNKIAEFTVNVKESVDASVLLNGTAITVPMANYKYTVGKTVSAFNRYEISYSSDAYVKGVMLMGETTEEFFLEPAQDGVFSGYIDGFLSGTTQSQITSISFTSLDTDFMDFTLNSVTTTDHTVPDNMVYLSSSDYKIGIDLKWGGALTYLEDLTNSVVAAKNNQDSSLPIEVGFSDDFTGTYTSGGITLPGIGTIGGTQKDLYTTQGGVNLINCNDTGRLVQQSYYGTGSYPYEPGDYNGVPWNYNPVQGGNVHNEPSKIVDLQVTENEIYVKCRPLDWGKTAEHITPSYMEAWYTLEDGLMRATCRFVDYSGYPEATTTQELPAFYCVEPLNNFVYYSGGEPWSDSNTKVTESSLQFWGDYPDQFFNCNENWAAFIGDDADSFGIGLYCPGQTNMYTGVFNRDLCTTVSPATESPTSYIAAVDTFTFKSFNPFSYAYYITTGDIDTIRSNFKEVATDPADPCNVGYTNGFCNNCGKYEVPTLTTDKYDLNGDNAFDNVYEISNAGELYWFREVVNNGDVNANAVLVDDITDNSSVLADYGVLSGDTSKLRVWEPIGNSTNKYNGFFDGQGHTVSGVFVNNSAKSYVGLFGCTDSNAHIEKIDISDSYFGGNQYVGCFVGYNGGTVENCCNIYTVTRGSSYVGGTSGYTNGVVKNCYNAGIVNANNYIGGVAGSASSVSGISNCYYLYSCATDGSSVIQNGVGNSAKGSTTADTASATEMKTAEEFASGEVAYLLQKANTEQVWGQKINQTGAGPVFDFDGKYKVIAVEGTGTYSLISIGDVENDGDVDIYDYQQLVNAVLSGNKNSDDYTEMLRKDLDSDGYLDVIDCALMERMLSGYFGKIDVYLKGDFDFDGVAFTEYDISAIKNGIQNADKISAMQKYACDLNFDGILDNKDIELLAQQEETASIPFTSTEDTTELRNKTANVIILCGQSNAYGASPLTAEVKAAVGDTDFSNVKIKYNNINTVDGTNWATLFSNNKFETFRLGIGGQAENWFGPELGLSHYLATNEATKDEMWYIIKYTAAGTYLGGDWLFDTSGKYLNEVNHQNIYNSLGGYLADLMIPYVNSALDEIAAIHGVGKINIRSFMWMQGESDSLVKEWADQYGDLQNILVNQVRTEFEPRDADAHIGFVDGGIAAYNSTTFVNPQANNATQTYNSWVYSDTVNTHKTNNASLWYVPAATSKNIINKTTAGLYTNTSTSSNKLPNSIWIDTSTCKSKLENNVENGEYDGAHYCGESMLNIGKWFGYGMTEVSGF